MEFCQWSEPSAREPSARSNPTARSLPSSFTTTKYYLTDSIPSQSSWSLAGNILITVWFYVLLLMRLLSVLADSDYEMPPQLFTPRVSGEAIKRTNYVEQYYCKEGKHDTNPMHTRLITWYNWPKLPLWRQWSIKVYCYNVKSIFTLHIETRYFI